MPGHAQNKVIMWVSFISRMRLGIKFFCECLGIHRSYKLVQSFEVGLARHAQSDWKRQLSYISKMNIGMNLIFRWGTLLYMPFFLSFCLSVHLSCTISQEPYIISSQFLVHMCKILVSSGDFSFFWNLFFWAVRGRGGVKGQKIT